MFGPLLEVEMSKKCVPLWREAHFEVKSVKNWWVRSTFGRSDVVLRGRRKGFCTLWTVRRTWKFSSSFNSVGRRGTFWRGSTKMHFAWQAQYKRHVHQRLGGQGADFLRGVAFWSIRSSGLLRWFCVTGAAFRMTWHHFSRQAQHFRQMEWKNCKTQWYEAVSSAPNGLFLKEVSQNCFVFKLADSRYLGR